MIPRMKIRVKANAQMKFKLDFLEIKFEYFIYLEKFWSVLYIKRQVDGRVLSNKKSILQHFSKEVLVFFVVWCIICYNNMLQNNTYGCLKFNCWSNTRALSSTLSLAPRWAMLYSKESGGYGGDGSLLFVFFYSYAKLCLKIYSRL